jgi:site-specific recombinase XerD
MHYLPVQRNLSGNTIKSYRDTFKLLLTFCRDDKNMSIAKLSLKQLDKKCIEDFLLWLRQSRNASPSTYNQCLCAIHAFFDYVMTEEPAYIEQCQKILKIKSMDTPEKPAAYLTAKNLGALLAGPDISTKQGRRHLTILSVLYDTAARVSELTDVRILDVRLEAPACITQKRKNGKIRTVPLMKQT